jgi:zinc transport system substrate-binding protein
MRRGRHLLASLTIGALASPALADAPDVVVSIKPIHSLVAGVMDGVGEPILLVKGFGSEHSYSLRPSQARALENAAVVFWLGETMETFLIEPLNALAGDARIVKLGQVPGLTLLPTREGGMWETHEHAHDGVGHGEEEHGEGQADHDERAEPEGDHGAEPERAATHVHGGTDMHVWLDPKNAKVLVDAIVTVLSDADPENEPSYQANGAGLQQALDELDRSLEERLATVADRPYVAFHDAYQYFESRYGLNAVGAITINPTQPPGAERIREIRERLEHVDAACVFAEPQFEPALVATVTEGTSARSGVLDPLGATLDEGPDQYFRLLENLAGSLIDCLGAAKSG